MAVVAAQAGPAAGNQHGGIVFLDNGGATDLLAACHGIPAPHIEPLPRAVEPHLPLSSGAKPAVARPRKARRGCQPSDRGSAQGHDLDRGTGIGIGESLPMHCVEVRKQRIERALVPTAPCQRHRELKGLAAIAHVG
jgi:hypothetical protein